MAQYKFETLAEQDVTWNAKDGKTLVISVKLVQESMDYFGTGDYKPTNDGLEIVTDSSIGGVDQSRGWLKDLANVPGLVAHIGKIGLTADRLELVNKAYAAVKSHPAWQAKQAAIARADAISKEYEAHTKAVDRMMMPGGSY